jgi:quercetin dioxygenase-like cupin family protein
VTARGSAGSGYDDPTGKIAQEALVDSYAVVNLMDLDNALAGQAEGLEARFARPQLGSRDLGVSHWSYAPGARSRIGHRHREQEEAYVVVAGSGRALLDGEVVVLRRWDVVRIAPEVVRAFEAGPEGMDVVAIGGPLPAERDGEFVEVTWPE